MRTSKRIVSTITDRAGLEESVGQYARIVLEKEAVELELTERTRKIREDYEEKSAALAKKADAAFDDISSYAAIHPEEFPKDKKSIDLLHGTIGYRTGMPRLLLPRGREEAEVVGELKSAGLGAFVRQKEELDRAKILSSAAQDDNLRDAFELRGIRVSQVERFFVDIKREQTDAAAAE